MTVHVSSITESRLDAMAAERKKFDCSHEVTELRERTIKGGHTQYVHQCLRCGESASKAISKHTVSPAPPKWDMSLRDRHYAARDQAVKQVEEEYKEHFWDSYDIYLKSSEWAERRRLVMERAQGICEGCRLQRGSQVHHLTYEHVGKEFLFELVWICKPCHERHHDKQGDDHA